MFSRMGEPSLEKGWLSHYIQLSDYLAANGLMGEPTAPVIGKGSAEKKKL
jgi:hypothetical protein